MSQVTWGGGYNDVEPEVKIYENNIFILVNNLPEQNNIKKCYKSVVEVKTHLVEYPIA